MGSVAFGAVAGAAKDTNVSGGGGSLPGFGGGVVGGEAVRWFDGVWWVVAPAWAVFAVGRAVFG